MKKKKKTPKKLPKRRKPNARQSKGKQPRAKSRPRSQAGADVTQVRTRRSGKSSQSGDTQGLSGVADVDSESVKELAEEGQYLEAEVVDAVENAPDPDSGEVRTKEVPEDDVPEEYRTPDQD